MKTFTGWLYFALVQLIALALFPVGLVLIGYKAFTREWDFNLHEQKYHWAGFGGRFLWLFGNDEDGIFGPLPMVIVVKHPRWQSFYWCALRNPVNNLRFAVGDTHERYGSSVWLQVRARGYYFQMGFRPDTGWPVISAGRGQGTEL